jgi:asparagine synthase (glutamine-hydrolysing)
MGNRYFAAIGGDAARADTVRHAALTDPGWRIALDRPGCLVVAERDAMLVPIANDGLVIGPLFALGRSDRLDAFSASSAAALRANSAAGLVHGHWGGYVAIVADTDHGSVTLVRAPFGELPCFHAPSAQGWAVASDVALLERFGGFRPRLDWPALGDFLCAPRVRSAATCLSGLSELRGGEQIRFGGAGPSVKTLWSPWTFADPARELADGREAAKRLHGEILAAVGARGSTLTRSVLMLSGGLDSSIIAASAAARGLDLHCANVSTDDSAGDERRYARAVCERLGVPLAECLFELDGVDLEASAAAGLPRPASRAFEYEARRQAHLVAGNEGADAVLSGGGGDNIFCSLQSVLPLLDCRAGLADGPMYRRLAREIAALCDTSVWTVRRKAWLRSWQHRPPPLDIDTGFLSAATAARARAASRHPWLEPPATVLPGKGAHVALLLGPQYLTEDSDPCAPRRFLYPLLAQPVVELCLRIPTWLWFERGCNRAVARRAFEAALPEQVAWRRSKGSPDAFLVALFESRRQQIRTLLLDGNLAGRGLLDCDALAAYLDDPRPVRGSRHVRILRLVDAEAWSRCWPG